MESHCCKIIKLFIVVYKGMILMGNGFGSPNCKNLGSFFTNKNDFNKKLAFLSGMYFEWISSSLYKTG